MWITGATDRMGFLAWVQWQLNGAVMVQVSKTMAKIIQIQILITTYWEIHILTSRWKIKINNII